MDEKFILYIVIGLFIVIYILSRYFKSIKFKGKFGEFYTNSILKSLARKYRGKSFKSLMFKDNISTSQVDNMLLTCKALYVIEVKNYKGRIYGSEDNNYWIQTIKHINEKKLKSEKTYYRTHIAKNKLYNPIRQNATHINKIKRLTKINRFLPIKNIVVFGDNAVLMDIDHKLETYIVNQRKLRRLIKKIQKANKIRISKQQLLKFAEQIEELNIKDKKERKEHIKRIKVKYNK